MRVILNWLARLLSTVFYTGYFPFISGTFASAVGLVLCWLLYTTPVTVYLAVTLLVIGMGFCFSGRVEAAHGHKDPSYIVIDEIAGMLVTFFLIPFSFKTALLGFLLFRILDTIKPYPADRLQQLKGSIGIMSDDLVAGVYANLVLRLALFFHTLF